MVELGDVHEDAAGPSCVALCCLSQALAQVQFAQCEHAQENVGDRSVAEEFSQVVQEVTAAKSGIELRMVKIQKAKRGSVLLPRQVGR